MPLFLPLPLSLLSRVDRNVCHRVWVRGLLLLLLCATFSGCQGFCYPCLPSLPRLGIFRQPIPEPYYEPQKYSLFTSPELMGAAPLRVVLVPTGTQAGRYHPPTQFADSMAAAMRGAGVCEVVVPPDVACNATLDGILTGQFDEREVARLARTWHCDAVLFVRVNQFQGHAPLQASVTAALVDARESIVMFAVDGNWDTADPDIKVGYEHFVDERTADSPEMARRIQLQSPSNLFDYVAHQMTGAWKQAAGL